MIERRGCLQKQVKLGESRYILWIKPIFATEEESNLTFLISLTPCTTLEEQQRVDEGNEEGLEVAGKVGISN
jgi:hypothetical protein